MPFSFFFFFKYCHQKILISTLYFFPVALKQLHVFVCLDWGGESFDETWKEDWNEDTWTGTVSYILVNGLAYSVKAAC